jgi:hypothetical protein
MCKKFLGLKVIVLQKQLPDVKVRYVLQRQFVGLDVKVVLLGIEKSVLSSSPVTK